MRNFAKTTTVALTMALCATASAAMPDLRNNDEVFSRLLTTAIAHEVREKCVTIEARKIAATFYVIGIVNYAKKLGYSMDQIDEFRFDPVQQDRLRSATYAHLDEKGVDRDDPASYCPYGVAEIQSKSQIGKLLKSR